MWGVGLGKAVEIPEAIRKGKEDAMKKLINVVMDESASVPHDFIGKFGGASVLLKRAPEGYRYYCRRSRPYCAGACRN